MLIPILLLEVVVLEGVVVVILNPILELLEEQELLVKAIMEDLAQTLLLEEEVRLLLEAVAVADT